MEVVVAGFGNVLRGDDGFGVEVARRLLDEGVPPGVTVLDVGIGGIHLVQRLLDPVDALIVVDAVDLGRPPGTLLVIRPDPPDIRKWPPNARRDALADMHYATPERTFLLAAALERLPSTTLLVGCQRRDDEQLGEGLSEPVAAAVEPAVVEIRRLLFDLGAR